MPVACILEFTSPQLDQFLYRVNVNISSLKKRGMLPSHIVHLVDRISFVYAWKMLVNFPATFQLNLQVIIHGKITIRKSKQCL
jgi:hypothetical protein